MKVTHEVCRSLLQGCRVPSAVNVTILVSSRNHQGFSTTKDFFGGCKGLYLIFKAEYQLLHVVERNKYVLALEVQWSAGDLETLFYKKKISKKVLGKCLFYLLNQTHGLTEPLTAITHSPELQHHLWVLHLSCVTRMNCLFSPFFLLLLFYWSWVFQKSLVDFYVRWKQNRQTRWLHACLKIFAVTEEYIIHIELQIFRRRNHKP